MIPDRHQLVERIFLEATELPETTRDEFLSARCAGDGDLRREVESLLGAHEGGEGLLDEPQPMTQGLIQQLSGLLRADDASIPPTGKIGAYRVIRVLGSGGMGVVYLAEQERPKRTVALKVIRRGLATASLLRRFEHEAEILGRLHHAGIAQIYEAGVANDGFGPQPYIAMEYIDGRALTDHAAINKLGVREKLVLMARVCDAVQHAHQRGVIHRDLKPGNILVQAEETRVAPATDGTGTATGLGVTGVGEPKVLDFGVARLAEERHGVTTMGTNVGQLIGTLAYMSPEQLGNEPSEVDTRSDVYALGVILFQLLAGRLPYDLGSRALPEAVRMVKEEPPARLSSIRRELRGDLETIVSKAIEKDKSRRYQSAADLGADLRRFLLGEAISAKRDSALYVIGKQIKKYKWAATTAAAFVVLLMIFAVYASFQATEKSQLAKQERAAKEEVIAEREKLERTLYSARIGFAQAALSSSDAERMRRELEACPARFRGWEWDYLARLADTSAAEMRITPDGNASVNIAAAAGILSSCVASLSPDVRFWDIRKAQQLPTWTLDQIPAWTVMPQNAAWFSAGFASARLSMYDLPTRTLRWSAPAPEEGVRWVTAAPDGSCLVTGGVRTITVWDPRNGNVIASYPNAGAGVIAAIDPGVTMLATGSSAGVATVHALATGEVLKRFTGHTLLVRNLAFNADTTRLVTASSDKSVRVWDLVGDAPPVILWPHTNKVWCAVFSPDGKSVISGSTDSSIRVTDIATGEIRRTLLGHSNSVTQVTVDPVTGSICSASLDLTARTWTGWQGPESPALKFNNGSWLLAATPDCTRLFVEVNTRNIGVIDAATLRPVAELVGHTSIVRGIVVARDGKRMFSVGNEGMLIEWDLGTYDMRRLIKAHQGIVFRVLMTPDQGAVVTLGADGLAKFWDPVSGDPLRTMTVSTQGVNAACFSPDGSRFVTGGFDRVVRVWDRRTGAQVAELAGFGDFITGVTYTPDGAEIIVSVNDGTVRSWDPDGHRPVRTFVGHKLAAYFASFFPDGTRMVTGGYDNTVRVWDPATGQELLTLRGHISSVFGVAFSPDGRKLFAVSDDGRLLVWDSTPPKHHAVPLTVFPGAQ